MIGHPLRYNKEFHGIILEGMIKGKHRRRRPRTRYKSQIIKDVRVNSYKHLKDKTRDRGT